MIHDQSIFHSKSQLYVTIGVLLGCKTSIYIGLAYYYKSMAMYRQFTYDATTDMGACFNTARPCYEFTWWIMVSWLQNTFRNLIPVILVFLLSPFASWRLEIWVNQFLISKWTLNRMGVVLKVSYHESVTMDPNSQRKQPHMFYRPS